MARRSKSRGKYKKRAKLEPGVVDATAAPKAPVETASKTPFETVVAESKERIAKETAEREPKRRSPRPVGRPRMEQPKVTVTAAPEVKPEEPREKTPDMTEVLIVPIQALSRLPAYRYKIEELAFNEAEATAVASSLNGIIQAFLPFVSESDPRVAAVGVALATVGAISFQKYMIYQQEMAKRAPEKPPEVQDEVNDKPFVDGTNYFRREIAN